MPLEVSYEWVQPHFGGEVVAWVMDDHTVPVRRIKEGHLELRCVDATRPWENGVSGLQSNGIPENPKGHHGDKANGGRHVMDSSALEPFLRVKRFERDSLARKDPEEVRTMLSKLF
ncbi:hypothetical protein N7447_000147 [Penicillium robsamsonii]|uniref:uncharacterized protein n=1 Tax=Penicillium robsamsonii TaxID=1792511 RepID=UPI002549954F|nr:uncharacterized protein N7447_000147 [Penicillium robsamsonii]KAJ5834121.1 hypothetical protein N7447_000147 [Penicillium robsamsonii]